MADRDTVLHRLDSYRRAIGLIRAKAVIWPGCMASPGQWFQEIIDVCDLATTAPVDVGKFEAPGAPTIQVSLVERQEKQS